MRGLRAGAARVFRIGVPVCLFAAGAAGGPDVRTHQRRANDLFGQAISAANSDPRTRALAGQLRQMQNQMNAMFSRYPMSGFQPYRMTPAFPQQPLLPKFAPLPPAALPQRSVPLPGSGISRPVVPGALTPGVAPLAPPSSAFPVPEGAPGARGTDPLSESVVRGGRSLEESVLGETTAGQQLADGFAPDSGGAVEAGGIGLHQGDATVPTEPSGLGVEDLLALRADTEALLDSTDRWLAEVQGDPAMREAAAAITQARQALREAQSMLAQSYQALQQAETAQPVPGRLQGTLPDLYGVRKWLLAGGYADVSVFDQPLRVHAPATDPRGAPPPETSLRSDSAFGGTGAGGRNQGGKAGYVRQAVWDDPDVVDLRDVRGPLIPVIPGGASASSAGSASPASSASGSAAGTPAGTTPGTARASSDPGTATGAAAAEKRDSSLWEALERGRDTLNQYADEWELIGGVYKGGLDAARGLPDANVMIDKVFNGRGYVAGGLTLLDGFEIVQSADIILKGGWYGAAEVALTKGFDYAASITPFVAFDLAVFKTAYGYTTKKVMTGLESSFNEFFIANRMPEISLLDGGVYNRPQQVVINWLGFGDLLGKDKSK